MQIVIEIPGEIRKLIFDGVYSGIKDKRVSDAIKYGIPLPEGHGRLIDADNALKEHCETWCKHKPNCEEDCAIFDTFNLAPTIIEEDKECNDLL